MDDTDRRLIGLLRDDGRASVAALAKRLGVARGTVQNRLAKLEADGTIVGYRAEAVLKALRGEPSVTALHTTNGRWDIVAEVRADSLQAFDGVLTRIRQLDGIASTETSLLLSTHKI
jgi:DNA-binding Lrp family transcriptional regulator